MEEWEEDFEDGEWEEEDKIGRGLEEGLEDELSEIKKELEEEIGWWN